MLSRAAAGSCRHRAEQARSGAPRETVITFGVKWAKQYTPRKELQKQAKQEYLKQLHEGADRIEEDHLVYELKPSSPRIRAQQQQTLQYAQLNRQLAEQIPHLQDWQMLETFVQQHAEVLNFLNIVALAGQAAALHQQNGAPIASNLMQRLAALILQSSSWFQPVHFTASAAAMGKCKMQDPAFWSNLVAAAEYKVGAFTFEQLAKVLEVLATIGFTPHLQWVERSYRQALKHIHAADAGDVCSLMWAWGEMGYTPRDRLFMNQVKMITRRAFDDHQLSGQQLVQLMHGIARMPRYAPNTGWLQALVQEVQRDIRQVTPGDLVDLLLSLTVIGFQPRASWLSAVAARLQDGLSSSITAPPPGSLLLQLGQQQQGPAGIHTAGVLVEQPLDQTSGLQQLQDLFAEAEEDYGEIGSGDAAEQQQLELPQQTQQLPQREQPGIEHASEPAQQRASNLDSPVSSSHAQNTAAAAISLQLSTEQLGILCWCIGRLNHPPDFRFMQRLGQELLHCLRPAPLEVVVDVLHGLVAVDCLPVGQLLQVLLDRVLELVPNMSPEALVRLCRSVVKLEQGLQQQQELHRDSSTWLQQYQQHHKLQIAAAVAHRQGIILWRSSCQQLADVLACIASSGTQPSPEYMATAVDRAVAKLLEQGAPASSVCTLIWALASLGFKPHPQQLHQLLAALQKSLHLLGHRDLANVAWGLCKLKHRPGTAWLGLYMKQVAAKASYMEPQSLTDTLWALACFAAQPDREWLKQILQAALKQVKGGGLSQQNAAVVVWALSQLGFQPQLFAQPAADGDSSRAAAIGGEIAGAVESLLGVLCEQPGGTSLEDLAAGTAA